MPSARMWLFTPRISASVAFIAMTTNIGRCPFALALFGETKRAEAEPLLHPARPVLPGPTIRGWSCRALKIEVGVHERAADGTEHGRACQSGLPFRGRRLAFPRLRLPRVTHGSAALFPT